jgi:hypothetical protein
VATCLSVSQHFDFHTNCGYFPTKGVTIICTVSIMRHARLQSTTNIAFSQSKLPFYLFIFLFYSQRIVIQIVFVFAVTTCFPNIFCNISPKRQRPLNRTCEELVSHGKYILWGTIMFSTIEEQDFPFNRPNYQTVFCLRAAKCGLCK